MGKIIIFAETLDDIIVQMAEEKDERLNREKLYDFLKQYYETVIMSPSSVDYAFGENRR